MLQPQLFQIDGVEVLQWQRPVSILPRPGLEQDIQIICGAPFLLPSKNFWYLEAASAFPDAVSPLIPSSSTAHNIVSVNRFIARSMVIQHQPFFQNVRMIIFRYYVFGKDVMSSKRSLIRTSHNPLPPSPPGTSSLSGCWPASDCCCFCSGTGFEAVLGFGKGYGSACWLHWYCLKQPFMFGTASPGYGIRPRPCRLSSAALHYFYQLQCC